MNCEKRQEILLAAAKALAKNCGVSYNPEEEDPKEFIHKILNLNPNKEKCEECKICSCRREEK